MEQCKIFISRSHGDFDRSGTYLKIYENEELAIKIDALHAPDIYDYETQTAKVDLSNCELALFVACYTAKEGVNTLPDAAVKAGADYAIGFEESITCGAASDWTREFFKLYENKYTVGYDIDFSTISYGAYDIVKKYDDYRNVETDLLSYKVFFEDSN